MNYLRFFIASTALALAVLAGGAFSAPSIAAQYAGEEEAQDGQEEMLYQEDENYQGEEEYIEEDEGQAEEGQEGDEDAPMEESEEEQ